MNDMVISGNIPSALQKYAGTGGGELGGGITSSFAVIAYKGKEWKIKYRGEYRLITRDDVYGDGSTDPSASIELVILKAPSHVSKVYYAKGYAEGDMGPPDCWSVNGVAPDAGAANKQSKTCAGCRWNAFGTAITRDGQGGKGKACADIKRLAVVPARDIENVLYGGPMLLRIPPDSLKEVKDYAAKLDQRGIPYNAVVTRVSFAQGVAHPKFVFTGARMLTDDEGNDVAGLVESDQVHRILEEAIETARAETPMGDDAVDNLSGPVPKALAQAPVAAAPAPAPTPAPAPAPAPAPLRAEKAPPKPKAEKAAAPAVGNPEEDDEEKKLIAQLEKLRAAKAAPVARPTGDAKGGDSFEGMLDEILPKK